MEKWLKGNDKEICLIQNERKSVVAERFSRTLLNIFGYNI